MRFSASYNPLAFDQVAIEARLPSLGLRAVSPTGKLGALSLLPSNKPIIHGELYIAHIHPLRRLYVESRQSHEQNVNCWSQKWRSRWRQKSHLRFSSPNDKRKSRSAQRKVRHFQKPHHQTSRHGLSKLNQTSDLTFFRPSGSDTTDLLFYPLHGKSKKFKFSDATDPEIMSLPPGNIQVTRN